MKTIEELKVDRTYYNRERDINGNITRTPYTKRVKRDPVVVTPTVRLGYFLLDIVFFYMIQFILLFIGGIVYILITKDTDSLISISENYGGLIAFSIFFSYYAITESALGGTFGKLICGYVVIDEYAGKVSFGKSLLRTIIRYVPFEAFSCIGERGWHDTWSKTYVVKRKERSELRKLLHTLHDDNDITARRQ